MCIRADAMLALQFVIVLEIAHFAAPAGAATSAPIVIQQPHGGELFFAGQQQTVRLDIKTKVKSVAIEISRDGGVTFAPLGTIDNAAKDKTLHNVLSFAVTGPGSNQCILRASGIKASPGLSGTFTISANASAAQAGSVTMLELADGSVTNPKLAALAVSSEKVTSDAASPGMVLASDGLGHANWSSSIVANLTGNVTGSASSVSGIIAVANGGTGSSTQNFVDLISNQSNIAGNKTFIGALSVSTAFQVEPRPNNSGIGNLFVGAGAGAANDSGTNNTFIGVNTGPVNTFGMENTFVGKSAGAINNATDNTFVGAFAGMNANGLQDTFVGAKAGQSSSGNNNSFLGYAAGFANTSGDANTFIGAAAGASNQAGTSNTFVGRNSGSSNLDGINNAFFGVATGQNSNGTDNTFVGVFAGGFNTGGASNVFVGRGAGTSNTVEDNNTLIGALANGSAGITNATAIGYKASVTASNSLVLGSINGANGALADTSVGIRTSAPNSDLQINGALSLPFRSSSTSATFLNAHDFTVALKTGATTASLPTAVGISGRIYVIKNKTTQAITLSAPTQTIDGAANVSIGIGAAFMVQSDGANWFQID